MAGLIKSLDNMCVVVYNVVFHKVLYNMHYDIFYCENEKRLVAITYKCPVCEFRVRPMDTLRVTCICILTRTLFIDDYAKKEQYSAYMIDGMYVLVYRNCENMLFNDIFSLVSYFHVIIHGVRIVASRSVSLCLLYSYVIVIPFYINAVMHMSALCYWYRVGIECGSTFTNRCVSPLLYCILHSYNLCLYIIVTLCYTGAFRLVFMMFNICISYIAVLFLTCDCYNTDIKCKQSVNVPPQIGALRPVRSGTSYRNNLIYHIQWLLIIT